MESIKQFFASIFLASLVIYVYFFTSVGRSGDVSGTLRLSDDLIITSDTIFSFLCLTMFAMCMVAAIRSLNTLFNTV